MKNKIHLRLNYSTRIILEEETEPEENSKYEAEGEDQDEDHDEVHVDVNNEIIEAWMIYIWLDLTTKSNKMIIVDFAIFTKTSNRIFDFNDLEIIFSWDH